jgi:hypothetical protein
VLDCFEVRRNFGVRLAQHFDATNRADNRRMIAIAKSAPEFREAAL